MSNANETERNAASATPTEPGIAPGGMVGDQERERVLAPPLAAPTSGDVARLPKPETSKRAIAVVIDAVIAVVIGLIPVIGGIVAAAYWLCRDGLDVEFMYHRSMGKKLMKLRPVRLDGGVVDLATSVRRNWMFALGGVVSLLLFIPIIGWLLMVPVGLVAFGLGLFELFNVLTSEDGRRWGDKLAGTKVIETVE